MNRLRIWKFEFGIWNDWGWAIEAPLFMESYNAYGTSVILKEIAELFCVLTSVACCLILNSKF